MTDTSFSHLLPDLSADTIRELLLGLNDVSRSSVAGILADKRVEEYVISFSAGIDSSILSILASDSNRREITMFGVASEGSYDAIGISTSNIRICGSLLTAYVTEKDVVKAAKEVSRILGSEFDKISHLEDCVAFLLIGNELQRAKPGVKHVVTANGPDELYCGYDRYRRIMDTLGVDGINLEIPRALAEARALKEKVKVVLESVGLQTLDPFLSDVYVRYGLSSVPVEAKLRKGDDRLRKRLWRAYGRQLGLHESIVLKPKKAMQYSMGLHRVVFGLVKRGEIKIGTSAN